MKNTDSSGRKHRASHNDQEHRLNFKVPNNSFLFHFKVYSKASGGTAAPSQLLYLSFRVFEQGWDIKCAVFARVNNVDGEHRSITSPLSFWKNKEKMWSLRTCGTLKHVTSSDTHSEKGVYHLVTTLLLIFLLLFDFNKVYRVVNGNFLFLTERWSVTLCLLECHFYRSAHMSECVWWCWLWPACVCV